MSGHVLVVDAGNTNVVFGVFSVAGELVGRVRLVTLRERTSDEYAALLEDRLRRLGLDPGAFSAVVVGSVVPPLDPTLAEVSRQVFGREPLFIEPGVKTGLPLRIENPSELGADRIVNAIAVRERHPLPAVVVDFGTATTFDVVSRAGAYAGGVIAPGIGTSAEALFERAARLPRVEIRRPEHVIGRGTVESMRSGFYHGYAGLIRGILERIEEELAEGRPTVVATGGLARVFAEEALFDAIEPDLTLHGLFEVHERRREARKGRRQRGA